MATTRGTIEAQRKRAKMKKKLDAAKARQREGVKGKRQEYLPEKVDIDAKKSVDRHEKARKNRAKNKTRRNPNQSSLDKIEYQMNQLEDFDVSTGFAEEESHGQRVKRVLYSMITSNLTLEEIAELVVDTYDSAKDSDDSFLEF